MKHEWRTCTKCKKRYFVSISPDLAGEVIETYFMGLKKISERHASSEKFVCAICDGSYKPAVANEPRTKPAAKKPTTSKSRK